MEVRDRHSRVSLDLSHLLGETQMGKFELMRGMDGHYYFLLKAQNGTPLVLSQAYSTKRAAEQAIESVRRIAADASFVDKCNDAKNSSRR